MNSGVPGSPRNGGPPFQAYQYVLRVPSASFLVIELMPFSLTRMFGHPCVERTGSLRLRFVGLNLNHALWINPDRTDRAYWYPAFDHALGPPCPAPLRECGRCPRHIPRPPASRSSAHASGPEPEPLPLRVSAWRSVSTEQPCCSSRDAATAASRAFTSMAVPCLAVLRKIRSEERRVGKECTSGGAADREK